MQAIDQAPQRPLVLVQSPLNAPTRAGFQRNMRYLLWCCRAEVLAGYDPHATHLTNPFFLDDTIPEERALGYASRWGWILEAAHHAWMDLGNSPGMGQARLRLSNAGIAVVEYKLPPEMLEAFLQGEVPPHTPGFELDVIGSTSPTEWLRRGTEFLDAPDLAIVKRLLVAELRKRRDRAADTVGVLGRDLIAVGEPELE